MSPEKYIRDLQERLQADGCDLQWTSEPTPILVSHRSDFKVQWMATKIHLFTIATVTPQVTVAELEEFTDFAMQTAIGYKDRLPRGIQTGLAVFPTLVSESVEPTALQLAGRWQELKFACMARPTVVDTTTQAVGAYRGTPLAGILYAPYLRKKNEQYFPQPE